MKLIFVYNSKSGAIHTLLDAGHKLFSPSTYNCNLCALTHNTFTESKLWKSFRETSTVDMEFLHSDEFEARFPHTNYTYPIVLKATDNTLDVFIPSDLLNAQKTLQELIDTISETLKTNL